MPCNLPQPISHGHDALISTRFCLSHIAAADDG
jgi:hypothetical protein